ncbi:hypothetical protein EMPG_14009 [Blastomyces silverae]|uniref:Uncharacterized protein n=1 Tax=Blastomyces silverae TaxID=2060906 RepID=A0A0H1BHL5_9EURO|nr:hypothetical protein EMPG_14009 [Blastomyces silverae]
MHYMHGSTSKLPTCSSVRAHHASATIAAPRRGRARVDIYPYLLRKNTSQAQTRSSRSSRRANGC